MDYKQWLKKESYTTDGPQTEERQSWSRTAKYSHIRCKDTNALLNVVVTRFGDGTFSMSVNGRAREWWTTISADGIDEATIIKSGRAIEHRLIGAWIEMAA